MRLIQRSSSKKDLINLIQDLEKENKKLKADLSSTKSTAPLQDSIHSSVLNELLGIDFSAILLYNRNKNSFTTVAISANSAFNGIIHYENIADICHPDDKAALKSYFENLTEDSKIQTIEFRHYHNQKDSKDIRVSQIITSALKNDRDEDILLSCFVKDITKQTKTQKELIKSKEKAEDADKLKTIFLSNISHYIRTPLNSIVGFAEILSISDHEKEKRREFLHIIKNQSKNLLNIIDDVAEIAKYESGIYTITKSPCNLNLLLNELLINNNEIRSTKRKEQVNLELILPSDEGVISYTDSGRLQQIIQNLLTHSLRNTNQGYIKFGHLLPSEGKIEFFIKDTSTALSKEDQKLVFNRFSSLEISENLKYEDASLSLTIAKHIVKLIGGKIWVKTDEEIGNDYHFTIPYEAQPSAGGSINENEISFEEQFDWRNKIILVVEDEEVNGMFIEAVLHGTNSQVIYAKNGHQALELAKTLPKIDLILMDIKMPVMNGIKATQEIRKFNRKIPIIAQTALASEEDLHNCELAGCNETITKPIEVEELLMTINNYLAD